jgi:hypothetical protein
MISYTYMQSDHQCKSFIIYNKTTHCSKSLVTRIYNLRVWDKNLNNIPRQVLKLMIHF